ncbi:hypothetical protein KKI90_15510 [Xenorhabdus bovienii]|uniref:hypothetical protein n=1 Tax=Xenorhabdus bovienii TaxID=40576 RepID=UPI00237CFDD6|nr:hypothetical protein [Xenorhabdus bovienii]MDE1487714.1 hypothetical protein [Xenorhabdus bovienii]MDE9478566.1 hypothetical protein [Xenorhabdus bovienii]MDE9531453.1 hypothetical protein [Xenorhabdus bovienii]
MLSKEIILVEGYEVGLSDFGPLMNDNRGDEINQLDDNYFGEKQVKLSTTPSTKWRDLFRERMVAMPQSNNSLEENEKFEFLKGKAELSPNSVYIKVRCKNADIKKVLSALEECCENVNKKLDEINQEKLKKKENEKINEESLIFVKKMYVENKLKQKR